MKFILGLWIEMVAGMGLGTTGWSVVPWRETASSAGVIFGGSGGNALRRGEL